MKINIKSENFRLIASGILLIVVFVIIFAYLSNINQKKAMDTNTTADSIVLNVAKPYPAPEFKGVTNWLNSSPLKMADLRGKVVIIDFWTYSCINCIRTLPYLKQWNDKYKDKGLVIIGVHAPEFAFERVPENVASFVKDHGITYPVVQDNDMATWNAYGNQYWPAKYFIDKKGNIVHTHFGEGEYTESELVIQKLLAEGDSSFTIDTGVKEDDSVPISSGQTPETYLGYNRAQYSPSLKEAKPEDVATFSNISPTANGFTLEGRWYVYGENITSADSSAKLKLNFTAKDVYLVMGAAKDSKVKVLLNGNVVDSTNKGEDVDADGFITVNKAKLYKVIHLDSAQSGQVLELQFPEGVDANAFTFGS